MHRLALSFALFLSTAAFADDLVYVEPVDNAELAQGICADPNMRDEDRADMVSRSRAEAIRCMGEAWVESDRAVVQPAAAGDLSISADVARNKITVIDRYGNEKFMLTSPGLPGTPTKVWKGRGPFRVEGADYVVQSQDKDYVGAPMPYAIFYFGGYAFHGTDQVKRLGRPASHGCLRMFTHDAKWLNQQVRMANDSSVFIDVYNAVPVARPKPRRPRPVEPRYEEDPYARPVPRYRERDPYEYGYPNYERPYNPWGL